MAEAFKKWKIATDAISSNEKRFADLEFYFGRNNKGDGLVKNKSKGGKFRNELDGLKEKLITGDEFNEIHSYFFDRLGENSEFMEGSKRAKNPMLKTTIKALSERLFQKKVTISHMMILKYPKTPFYHGSCFVEGRIAGLIFFEDINMGMFSVVINYPETSFLRFSMIQSESVSESSRISPIRSKMVH